MAQFVTIAGRAVNVEQVTQVQKATTTGGMAYIRVCLLDETTVGVYQEEHKEDYKALCDLIETLPPITSLLAQRKFFG